MNSIFGSKVPLREGDYKPLDIVELREQDDAHKAKLLAEATELTEKRYAEKNPTWSETFIPPKSVHGHNDSILRESASIAENSKQKFFIEMVYRIFYKSLILDEDFKSKSTDKLRRLVEDSLFGEGSFDTVFAKLKTKSSFLNELCRFCETAADEKAADNAAAQMEDETPVFQADVEDEVIEKALDNLGAEELADLVMEKVTQVITDEKEEDETRENMMGELVDIVNSNADGEESVEVQVAESMFKVNAIDEYSLFKSIMINSQKEILSESDNLKKSGYLLEQDDGRVKVNMDYVLAEAITRYTLLETLYTMRVLDISSKELREMSINLAYQ